MMENSWKRKMFCIIMVLIFLVTNMGSLKAETTKHPLTNGEDLSSKLEINNLPKIKKEIVINREKNSKSYLNSDNTVTVEEATYSLHYFNGKAWQDIDNTLRADLSDSNNTYSMKSNNFKVKVNHKKNNQSVTFQVYEESVVYQAQNMNNVAGVVYGNTITYPNAWQSTDLLYQVQNDELKMELHLADKSAPKLFEFEITMKDVKARINSDDSIDFVDDAGKVNFKIPQLWLKDASSDNKRYDHLKVGLKQKGNKTFIQIFLDANGLQYPLIIDPTTVVTFNSLIGESSYGIETFEGGSYNATNYLAWDGTITNDPQKVISGQYSAYLSVPATTVWAGFSYSDRNKIHFEKNTNYTVTFKYKANQLSSNDSSYYFLARSTDESSDLGWTNFRDQVNSVGAKTITFTTGLKENYYLIWGVYNGGALSIDDIQIKKVSESFESGVFGATNYLAGSGTITSDATKIVSGSYSAYLSAAPNQEWKEFANSNSNKIHFEKYTTYSVTFSYKSIVAPIETNGGFFYFLARGTDGLGDKGMTVWNLPAGQTGTKTIIFTTANKENYSLMWGIHNGGAISVDDIQIKKLSESFESGAFNNTDYSIVSGALSNEVGKVISGSYSAYLSSPPNQEWNDFLASDTSKVHFEKNTTYSVTFSYKSLLAPPVNSNSYYYFIVRSTDATESLGLNTWTPQINKIGTKTIEFTTGNKNNYYFYLGIHNRGALSVDDIVIRKLSESFESGSFVGTDFLAFNGAIVADPSKVVNGSYSAYLSSIPNQEWSDFVYTNSLMTQFRRNTTYSVTFSYKSITEPLESNNGYFYFLARSSDFTEDKGWTVWNAPNGATATKTIVFTTGNKDNYFLYWGIHNGGALSLDDIKIRETDYQYDQAGRLTRYTLPNFRAINYYYDPNGNLTSQVIE